MNKNEKEQLKQLIEQLYNLNANISAVFVTKLSKPTPDDMVVVNRLLGTIIKELREMVD